MANDIEYWQAVYEKTLNDLAEKRAERDSREAEMEELSREIVRLEQAAASVAPLASNTTATTTTGVVVKDLAGLGLADACREVLKKDASYRTARGIRDSLAMNHYELRQHNNPLASIHGVLKRMADSGEIEELETEGKTRYRWKSANAVTIRASPGSGKSSFFRQSMAEAAAAKAVDGVLNARRSTAVQKAVEEAERLSKLK